MRSGKRESLSEGEIDPVRSMLETSVDCKYRLAVHVDIRNRFLFAFRFGALVADSKEMEESKSVN